MPGVKTVIATCLISLSIGMVGAALPAAAQTAPPSNTPTTAPAGPDISSEISSARSAIPGFQSKVNAAQARVTQLTAQLATLNTQIDQTNAKIQEFQTEAATAHARGEEVKKERAMMAIAAYTGGDTQVDLASQDANQTLAVQRQTKLASSVTAAQTKEIASLKRQEEAAIKSANEQIQVRNGLTAQRDKLQNSDLPTAQAQLAEVEAGLDTANATLARWQSVANGTNSTIMGPSTISGDDLARWFTGTGRKANITVSIQELANDYISEGTTEGVRGDIAFAQSILETGSFGFPPYGQLTPSNNNFAGIGACDSCAHGYAFPDARTGVRAQIQLLRNYADPTASTATLHNPPVMPHYDNFGLHGRAPTWQDLTGTWASSTTYGPKILGIYAGIVSWLSQNPPGS